MNFNVDLYWSFRSPYSYLAMHQYARIIKEYNIHINLRPVYPLAIREPNFFEKNHPNWLAYVIRDILRVAELHNIPLVMPNPDPIVQNIMTREISKDQPYIYSLTRLGQIAARCGKSFDFCHAVSLLIWGGTKDWHLGDHLKNAAVSAGLDWDDMQKILESDAQSLDADISDNQSALETAGHWGVPTLIFDGEPFFGQDRIELALWRMKKAGLKKR